MHQSDDTLIDLFSDEMTVNLNKLILKWQSFSFCVSGLLRVCDVADFTI